MIAEGIIFDIPFDMSSYTRDDVLERFTPFKNTAEWDRELIERSADNFNLSVSKDVVKTNDMVIKRYTPEDLSVLANLYLTTGIFDVACPKLCRVDMLDSGSLLQSYPYFPENPEYSNKIEQTISEIERVSLFILEIVGKDNLSKWKEQVTEYVKTYISFIDRKDFGNIGNKEIVKRIYKQIL